MIDHTLKLTPTQVEEGRARLAGCTVPATLEATRILERLDRAWIQRALEAFPGVEGLPSLTPTALCLRRDALGRTRAILLMSGVEGSSPVSAALPAEKLSAEKAEERARSLLVLFLLRQVIDVQMPVFPATRTFRCGELKVDIEDGDVAIARNLVRRTDGPAAAQARKVITAYLQGVLGSDPVAAWGRLAGRPQAEVIGRMAVLLHLGVSGIEPARVPA